MHVYRFRRLGAVAVYCACVSGLWLVSPAWAATYYVASNGSDSNRGTETDRPFQTISKAAGVAGPGDTVLIRGGTYRETVTPARSGTAKAPIVFQSYQGEIVTISGADVIPSDSWKPSGSGAFRAPMPWTMGPGKDQIYVDGIRLDAKERLWDLDSGELRLTIPQGGGPAGHRVEAKRRAHAFDLSGKSYLVVRGLRIFGANVLTSDSSRHNALENLQVRYASDDTLLAGPHDGSNTVTLGGLSSEDIGGASPRGGLEYWEAVFTIKGGGNGIAGASDQFHYAFAPCNNTNYEVVARVTALEPANPSTQCGIMIRETLDSDSKQAVTAITPSGGVNFATRESAGGFVSATQIPGKGAPIWLKMARNGNSFTSYYSDDGFTWTQVGSAQMISMASDYYVGLCLSSSASGMSASAEIDKVSRKSASGLQLSP